MRRSLALIAATTVIMLVAAASPAWANHSWGPYHWARTANPFTLKVVNSTTSNWDAHVNTAIAYWDQSTVLNLTQEQGEEARNARKRCAAISGKIRVCNAEYGFNGWLGVAQIWLTSGNHIAQAITKVNDSYFNTSTYNTSAWRQFVMCQEIGHDFGLDHQDENFNNANLGTCMDYTNNPGTNQHPNSHDYQQLQTIYGHTDSFNSYTTTSGGGSTKGKPDSTGYRVITHIYWVDGHGH